MKCHHNVACGLRSVVLRRVWYVLGCAKKSPLAVFPLLAAAIVVKRGAVFELKWETTEILE